MKLDLYAVGSRRKALSSKKTNRTRILLAWAAVLLLTSLPSHAQNTINTIAGGGNPVPGNTPLTASLGGAGAVVEDTAGNIYVSSLNGNYVFVVSVATGKITVLAGTGYSGYGTSGPATSSPMTFPVGMALDSTSSNIFIAAAFSQHVFEVNLASGTLTNFAGSGSATSPAGGFNGDGGPATQAVLNGPMGVVVSGNTVYIADSGNNRIRAVTNGTITTFAGNGTACASPPACGDGGQATQANLSSPEAVAVDTAGNLYISDTGDNEIREVSILSGTITTVAGDGIACSTFGCGDGGPATAANLNQPNGLTIAFNSIYIADENDERIRVVNFDSQGITTVAGDGSFGFSGDGGPPTSASLDDPTGVFVDSSGDVLISERGSSRIREVPFDTGTIDTIIGGGTGGDGGPALSAVFAGDQDVALDASGDIFLIDDNRVREITGGNIATVAGNGTGGFSGDGGAATLAVMNVPFGLAVDRTNGNIFIVDNGNNNVRTVQGGIMSTYAGAGTCSPPTANCGDGGPASAASFNHPQALTLGPNGNILIADVDDNRIRMVDNATGIVTTVAGTGNQCPVSTNACGDGGAATQASLTFPSGVAVDSAGDIFISDSGDNRVRRVDATTGNITTVAFNGQASFSGDGGAATQASMTGPGKIAVDASGNLYVAGIISDQISTADFVVRRVDAASGTVATVAGNEAQPLAIGFSGDGGPATAASLTGSGLAVNATGGLYIADHINNRIRFVQLSPAATLSVNSLDFGMQSLNVTSAPMPLTITNTGSNDLLITSIADAAGFSQTNNCPVAPQPLAPAQSCTINVTFTASATGNASSVLTITDNAAGSPQSVPLTAVVQAPFALTTNCNSLTVVPGQSAIYHVSLAPAQGFTKSVSLSCSGAPALAACTVNPAMVTLDGATTVEATVTATTTPATSAALQSPFGQNNANRLAGWIGLAGMMGLAGVVVLPGTGHGKQARRLWLVIFCLCMLSTMVTFSSCGGGSGAGGADPPGTAAGTYPLTVTATYQSSSGTAFSQEVSFNLVVQ
jgi:trimeric autotransporter adhesin